MSVPMALRPHGGLEWTSENISVGTGVRLPHYRQPRRILAKNAGRITTSRAAYLSRGQT
jgi:hypothetical protein